MDKRWVKIVGNYAVSDHGDVLCEDRAIIHRQVKQRIVSGRVMVSLGAESSTRSVHRLVAKAFIENPFGYSFVKHLDGNLQNNHYSNLKWAPKVEHDYICRTCGQKKDPSKFRSKNRPKNLADGTRVTYKRKSRSCTACEYQRKKHNKFNEIHRQFQGAAGVPKNGNPV